MADGAARSAAARTLELQLAQLPHHVPPAPVVQAVDVQAPEQVVRLVLEDPCEQTIGAYVSFVAVERTP